MVKKNVTAFAAAMLLASSFGTGLRQAKADDLASPNGAEFTKSSLEFTAGMGAGWNLGNTFDATDWEKRTNAGLQLETAWGAPPTTREMVRFVAASGFKTLRIPVSWHNHISDAASLKLDGDWLARVRSVADWAYDAGMHVIINVHHDNLAEADIRAGSEFGYAVAPGDAEVEARSLDYLTNVWRQVATEFRDYGERLVFELLNEPRPVGTASEWWNPDPSQENAVITRYEQACLDAVRATGGNNAKRYIMVPACAASAAEHYHAVYVLPKDSVDDRLIVSAHAYTPYAFAFNDRSQPDTTFGPDDEASVDGAFAVLRRRYPNTGVVIGETGASNKGNDADREKWARFFFGTAMEKYGMPSVLWDNGNWEPSATEPERYGLLDRTGLYWHSPDFVNAAVSCAAALLSAGAVNNSVSAEELPESARPVPQGTTGGHWYDRHLAKVAEAKAGGADVVFVGDSLTEFWETNGSDQWKKHFDTGAFKSMNLGFAGDRTEHVLWRLDNGELDGFAAKAVILEIGTNNSDAQGGSRTWEQINPTNTFVGVKAIIAKMREKQPSAKLIVHAIFPREWNSGSECRKRNEEVNALVKDYISTSGVANVVWCNFNDKLKAPAPQPPSWSDLLETGNFCNDGPIHLASKGYEVWGQAVLPLINDLLRPQFDDKRIKQEPGIGRFFWNPANTNLNLDSNEDGTWLYVTEAGSVPTNAPSAGDTACLAMAGCGILEGSHAFEVSNLVAGAGIGTSGAFISYGDVVVRKMLEIASGEDAFGFVNVYGGSLTAYDVNMAEGSGSSAVFGISAGVVSVSNDVAVGVSGRGRLDVAGGEFNIGYLDPEEGGWLKVGGAAGSTGVVNVTSGRLDIHGGAGYAMMLGYGQGRGELNINGGEVDAGLGVSFGYDYWNGGEGEINLDAGVLRTAKIDFYGEDTKARINFNGGTLKGAGVDGFVKAGIDVDFLEKGAVVDTDGGNLSVRADVGGVGGLVKEGSGTLLFAGAASYVGDTVVKSGTVAFEGEVVPSGNYAVTAVEASTVPLKFPDAANLGGKTISVDVKSAGLGTYTVYEGASSDRPTLSVDAGEGRGCIDNGDGTITLTVVYIVDVGDGRTVSVYGSWIDEAFLSAANIGDDFTSVSNWLAGVAANGHMAVAEAVALGFDPGDPASDLVATISVSADKTVTVEPFAWNPKANAAWHVEKRSDFAEDWIPVTDVEKAEDRAFYIIKAEIL